MNTICDACKQDITSNRSINCTLCEKNYHPICVNVTLDSTRQYDNWVCPSCRSKTPRTDNSNTPACSSATPAEQVVSRVNTQSRAYKRMAIGSPSRDGLEGSVSYSELVTEIRLMRSDMAEVKLTLGKLFDGMDKCNARLDLFEERIAALEQNSSQVADMNAVMCSLKDQLNQQSQAGMRNEIEIIGVEETINENLHHIAMVAATKIGVNLAIEDIDWTARAGLKKKGLTTTPDSNFPRPVIVKLLRRAKKDEIIKAFKTRRNLSSQDIEIQGPVRKIYINEHLTKENRILFREARVRAKNAGFKFCWTSRGQVLVRQTEGKTAIQIKNNRDLDHFLGTIPSTSPPFPDVSN